MYKTATTSISKNHFKNAFLAIDSRSVILKTIGGCFTVTSANKAYLKITDITDIIIKRKNIIDLMEAVNVFNTKYDAVLDDKARKYIAFAIAGAKRMRIIILDLLEFSRIYRIESSLDAVNMMPPIRRIEALLLKEIEEKRAKLPYNNLPAITSYAAPLHQVFQNLIGNALKHCYLTKAPIVSANAKDIGQYWQFEINEKSISMEAEYFPTLTQQKRIRSYKDGASNYQENY